MLSGDKMRVQTYFKTFFHHFYPSVHVETVTYKNLKFQVWDLGGQTSIRPYWRCYYSNTDAVIYS